MPVEALLSKEYAAQPRARDRPLARATRTSRPATLPTHGGDTTYLSVVDRDGNMVSLIQSNFANFGSGLVPDGAGFALQNRGGLFTLDPAHPNALAPRKRPLHTIIPGFMSATADAQSPSASWAAGTSRRRTRSSSRTSSITG